MTAPIFFGAFEVTFFVRSKTQQSTNAGQNAA